MEANTDRAANRIIAAVRFFLASQEIGDSAMHPPEAKLRVRKWGLYLPALTQEGEPTLFTIVTQQVLGENRISPGA